MRTVTLTENDYKKLVADSEKVAGLEKKVKALTKKVKQYEKPPVDPDKDGNKEDTK